MPNLASESRIAERFAAWLSHKLGRQYTVSPGGDPPDFIVQPEGWLEVTVIYLRNEQAKFLNSPREKRFGFSGILDETAHRLIAKLDEKLGKESYQPVCASRGTGILLLTPRLLLRRGESGSGSRSIGIVSPDQRSWFLPDGLF